MFAYEHKNLKLQRRDLTFVTCLNRLGPIGDTIITHPSPGQSPEPFRLYNSCTLAAKVESLVRLEPN